MRAKLDNPTISDNVPQGQNSHADTETLPNPLEGVNTHLLRNVAYMIGIVRLLIPTYTVQVTKRTVEESDLRMRSSW
jgi:hypothetical protein